MDVVSTGIQDAATSAEKAGASIGAGIGVTFLLIIWAVGDVILGIPLLFTRRAKIMVPID